MILKYYIYFNSSENIKCNDYVIAYVCMYTPYATYTHVYCTSRDYI